MIEVLDLYQPEQVGIVDIERRFPEQESPEVSLILELLAEPGVHGIDGVSPEEVVAAEWKASLDVGNAEGLPLTKLLGNISVEDEEEDKYSE